MTKPNNCLSGAPGVQEAQGNPEISSACSEVSERYRFSMLIQKMKQRDQEREDMEGKVTRRVKVKSSIHLIQTP